MNRRIYLDYCATTPLHPEVRSARAKALDENFGNPSSMHWAGADSNQIIKQARADVGWGIGCRPDEIVFTSGATEADNLALFGTLRRAQDDALRRFPADKAHLIPIFTISKAKKYLITLVAGLVIRLIKILMERLSGSIYWQS